MGQWHQQPVWYEGEDWDRFTGAGQSPPLAVSYFRLSPDDPSFDQVMSDPEYRDLPGFDPNWTDQSILLFTMGTPPEAAAFHPVEKGRWYDFEFRVTWSQGQAGRADISIDGAPLSPEPLNGPNMWNGESHYFKFGLYRNPDIEPEQILYYDDFSFSHP